MAISETEQRIIDLGKLLAESLGEQHSLSPLCQWMSHYLAEQIVKAESSLGDERQNAQDRCFDTILRLWKNRRDFPRGVQVLGLEDFETIFETLHYLHPESSRFWDVCRFPGYKEGESEITDAMDRIKAIDRIARQLIRSELASAAKKAANSCTMKLVEAASFSDDALDVNVAEKLVGLDIDMKLYGETVRGKLREEIEGLTLVIELLEKNRLSASESLRVYEEA